MNIEDRVYCSRMNIVEHVLSMNIEDRGILFKVEYRGIYFKYNGREICFNQLFLLNNSKSIGLMLLKFLTFPKYPKPSL